MLQQYWKSSEVLTNTNMYMLSKVTRDFTTLLIRCSLLMLVPYIELYFSNSLLVAKIEFKTKSHKSRIAQNLKWWTSTRRNFWFTVLMYMYLLEKKDFQTNTINSSSNSYNRSIFSFTDCSLTTPQKSLHIW